MLYRAHTPCTLHLYHYATRTYTTCMLLTTFTSPVVWMGVTTMANKYTGCETRILKPVCQIRQSMHSLSALDLAILCPLWQQRRQTIASSLAHACRVIKSFYSIEKENITCTMYMRNRNQMTLQHTENLDLCGFSHHKLHITMWIYSLLVSQHLPHGPKEE